MRSDTRFKWLLPILGLLVLAACTATVKPEWVSIYNHKADIDDDRLSWLEDMAVDSRGDVIVTGAAVRTGLANREKNLLFVKFDSRGNRIWARDFDLATGDYISDDDPRGLALDSSDNLYVLANQFRIIDDQTSSYGSWLISVDSNGDERWRRLLSDEKEMHGLSLSNDRLYVTGASTQVFSLNGEKQMQVDHSDHVAFSVAVNINGDFVLGGGRGVSYYRADGTRLWYQQDTGDDWTSGNVIFAMDGSIIATAAGSDNGSARISRYTSQGQKLWSSAFAPAYKSYGLPGPALVFEDYRGDIFLIASNADGHRVVKMDAAGGVYWNRTSRKGIVLDAALENGELFVVGDGQNGKYTSDGTRMAESEVGRSVQITTGSVALDGDLVYAGYSAEDNGTFALHLSQFIDR